MAAGSLLNTGPTHSLHIVLTPWLQWHRNCTSTNVSRTLDFRQVRSSLAVWHFVHPWVGFMLAKDPDLLSVFELDAQNTRQESQGLLCFHSKTIFFLLCVNIRLFSSFFTEGQTTILKKQKVLIGKSIKGTANESQNYKRPTGFTQVVQQVSCLHSPSLAVPASWSQPHLAVFRIRQYRAAAPD